MRELQLFTTEDGSHSIRVPELDETYHSRFGAVTESRHIYIQNGLLQVMDKVQGKVKVLEVGLGTGLNALLTCWESFRREREIDYWVLEPFPIPSDLADKLNFYKFLPEAPQNWLPKIHSAPWDSWVKISEGFRLRKLQLPVQKFSHERDFFDLLYFDAFAPTKQPEIWDCSIITALVGMIVPSGSLVSYSAQGKFKRCLKEAGCQISLEEGPPGKLHMVRAIKDQLPTKM